jgi:anti-anti-sigma factor
VQPFRSEQLMAGRTLVLSPEHALVAGGPAEHFEFRLQQLFEQDIRHVVVDLRAVTALDSRGVRALVRGHSTAQRLGGTFKIVGPSPQVRAVLQLSHLDRVFGVYETVDEARRRDWPWTRMALLAAGLAGCVALVWWDMQTGGAAVVPDSTFPGSSVAESSSVRPLLHPVSAVFKLFVAGFVGLLVTAVHKPYVSDRPTGRSMQQAQILLAVAGAMIMIIIGNSLARAFGIAGAASIIRFRTPVEDPKDVTILFLLMGLGMAAGLGAYAVAGLGTGFLCAFLLLLDRLGEQRARLMRVDVFADGREFPTDYVQGVFIRHRVTFETREVALGEKMRVRYHANIPATLSLEDLGAELMAGGAGVKSVAWEPVKD